MTAVGIDVGKRALDVAIDGAAGVVKFPNTAAGIRRLVRCLSGIADPGVLCLRDAARARTRTRPG